jgi:RNA polymerase sigma-70 factor (ECF subfamily)
MADAPNAARVYRELAPRVLGYLRAQRVPDPEDVLSEVFLHVARDIRRFKGDDAAMRRWVFSIAHNRVVDDRRRRARRPQAANAPMPDSPSVPVPDLFDPSLVEALATLSADQREVVVLRFVADLPLEAVARITGRRVGAVKALQHRALTNLARAVSPEGFPTLTEGDE